MIFLAMVTAGWLFPKFQYLCSAYHSKKRPIYLLNASLDTQRSYKLCRKLATIIKVKSIKNCGHIIVNNVLVLP